MQCSCILAVSMYLNTAILEIPSHNIPFFLCWYEMMICAEIDLAIIFHEHNTRHAKADDDLNSFTISCSYSSPACLWISLPPYDHTSSSFPNNKRKSGKIIDSKKQRACMVKSSLNVKNEWWMNIKRYSFYKSYRACIITVIIIILVHLFYLCSSSLIFTSFSCSRMEKFMWKMECFVEVKLLFKFTKKICTKGNEFRTNGWWSLHKSQRPQIKSYHQFRNYRNKFFVSDCICKEGFLS